MGVYVRNLKMPETCRDCYWSVPGLDYAYCSPGKKEIEFSVAESGRPDDCPMIEVKIPHGDLIDRDKLLRDNEHLRYDTDSKYSYERGWSVGFNAGAKHANDHVYYSKTVIPAEAGNDAQG